MLVRRRPAADITMPACRRVQALARHLGSNSALHLEPVAAPAAGRVERARVAVAAEGVVYSNPQPYLKAKNAWHPSVVALPNDEWFVGFDLGEAVESLDYRSVTTRSSTQGETWSEPVELLDPSSVASPF